MTLASVPEPRRLVRDVLLRDGWTLRLQTPMAVDYEDINVFYDGLSAESRYLRLHGFGRTDTVARADVEAGGVDRLALLGRHDGRVVAVASCDGVREPGVAEVAFAVADGDQRRGIGMRMWFASESTTQIWVLITQHLRGFWHDTEGVFDDRAGTFSRQRCRRPSTQAVSLAVAEV